MAFLFTMTFVSTVSVYYFAKGIKAEAQSWDRQSDLNKKYEL